ncbi:MAG: radical SAM family heme chaperone HemW [Eubacterium sp.]|nr:radical SAM family heme chaperone HemW [Eubacterium sp.]
MPEQFGVSGTPYMEKKQEIELYLHLPFCVKKCAYCDFLSFPSGAETQTAYVEALKREIRAFFAEIEETEGAEYCLRSVFIGGGTPSLLPAEQIAGILTEIRSDLPGAVSMGEPCEITIEANPGTLDLQKLSLYRNSGINRISIGCQSANDRELKVLGRIHSFADFQKSFRLAREAGFENINVDLMAGLPGQTRQSWEKTLRTVAERGPEHISAYSLILEEGTPLFRRYAGKDAKDAFPPLPDEETEREMYHRTEEILREYGFSRYEISNYAKKGYESVHNIGYWDGTFYKGFGLGAASLLPERGIPSGECAEGEGKIRLRVRNTEDLNRYLKSPSSCSHVEERLTEKDQMAEFMILGFRMIRGVSLLEFRERFDRNPEDVYGSVLQKQQSEGLLEKSGGRLRLTERGLDLANLVMEEYL